VERRMHLVSGCKHYGIGIEGGGVRKSEASWRYRGDGDPGFDLDLAIDDELATADV
jgi:hypothetical protein